LTPLQSVIQALTGPQAITVGTETARRLLEVGSVNPVKHWLELGILPGEQDERSGRWRIPLAAMLRLQAQQAALAEAGGEELTQEELATLSATRPGTAPWQHD
jgi:hypothetical protein